MAYGVAVQREYRQSWQLQQKFWCIVAQHAPDVADGTVVLVGGKGLEEVEQIGANTWATPRILPKMVRSPQEWSREPRGYRLVEGWQTSIIDAGSTFDLNGDVVLKPYLGDLSVSPADVILLLPQANGTVLRRSSINLEGESNQLKAPGPATLDRFQRTPLYGLLLLNCLSTR